MRSNKSNEKSREEALKKEQEQSLKLDQMSQQAAQLKQQVLEQKKEIEEINQKKQQQQQQGAKPQEAAKATQSQAPQQKARELKDMSAKELEQLRDQKFDNLVAKESELDALRRAEPKKGGLLGKTAALAQTAKEGLEHFPREDLSTRGLVTSDDKWKNTLLQDIQKLDKATVVQDKEIERLKAKGIQKQDLIGAEQAKKENEKKLEPIRQMIALINNESPSNAIELKGQAKTNPPQGPQNEALHNELQAALSGYHAIVQNAKNPKEVNDAFIALQKVTSELVDSYQPASTASESSKGFFSNLVEKIKNMLSKSPENSEFLAFRTRYAELKEQIKPKEEPQKGIEEKPHSPSPS